MEVFAIDNSIALSSLLMQILIFSAFLLSTIKLPTLAKLQELAVTETALQEVKLEHLIY